MKHKIIAIAGPTASGKTALSIDIAKKYGGEIVSCDSMQIYKGMNIGTAKPTQEEMQGIPHHMIDILEPYEKFSAADFANMAKECIDDIIRRGKLPILVGGTGLYMDSVIYNTGFSDAGEDKEYRAYLENLAEDKGRGAVYELLLEKDPKAAEEIHENNLKRVIRTLEIHKITGKTREEVVRESKREPLYDCLKTAISMPRDVLYERINRRVDIMIDTGLEGEVRKVCRICENRDTTAMQAIGYKEFIKYFKGETAKSEVIEKIKQESRRYAKRQLTWLRRDDGVKWIVLQDGYNYDTILKQGFTLADNFGIIT